MSDTDGDVIATHAGPVATLTLNRPQRHNAFDDGVIATLTARLVEIDALPEIRVLVLAGAGRSFSAGADLAWMQRMAGYGEAENLADAAALAQLMHTLDSLSKPTVALVHGAAYGGGVGLVACCDIAIATTRASFCLSEVRLGLTPATISPYVVRAIGARQARRYFQSAEVITAARALQIGLVHELVDDDALPAARDALLEALLKNGPEAMREAKSLVQLCEDTPIDAALIARTGAIIAARRCSPEGRGGVSAFLDKRPAPWTGEGG